MMRVRITTIVLYTFKLYTDTNVKGVFLFDMWRGAEKHRLWLPLTNQGMTERVAPGIYFLLADFLGRSTAWMLGKTPP